MRENVKRLFAAAEASGVPVDAVAIVNGIDRQIDPTFFQLTGFESGAHEGGVCVAFPDGSVHALATPLEEPSAVGGEAKVTVCATQRERDRAVSELLSSSRRVGFNAAEVNLLSYRSLERAAGGGAMVDISYPIRLARCVKTGDEVERIRGAAAIASRAFENLLPLVRPGMRESEVAAELDYLMSRDGARGPSFPTIVAAGANAAEPHHATGDSRLEPGVGVVIDFGARFGRYASDITRTIAIGEASPRLGRMHALVLEAQEAALVAMADGVDSREPDRAARALLDASEFKGRFTHSLGHTLGLSVHDGFWMNVDGDPRNPEHFVLREGTVVTVEPGLYIPGEGGVRVEDDVVLRSGRPRPLTTAPRDLLVAG